MNSNRIIFKSFYIAIWIGFTQIILASENNRNETNIEDSRFIKIVEYIGKSNRTSSVTITDLHTQTEYKLSKDEIMKMIQSCGAIRKEKQVISNNTFPLVSSKSIRFTSTINGKKITENHQLYEIKDRESKRKARDLIQKLYDESKKSNKPNPLFFQIGPDENTDITIIRPGLDIVASPLRKSEREKEGYLATKPPAYGAAVDASPKSFQKTLKLVEGARSSSAPVLRHIAQKDDDFIGKDKGGARKLRNYDEDKVTKGDEEKVVKLFADFVISKLKKKKALPSTMEIKSEIRCDLATETDSASFIVLNEGTEESEGYNRYITSCIEGWFKKQLTRIYENDPTLTEFIIDRSSDAWNGSLNVMAVSWALTNNTHLKKLDCSFNNTNDEGAQALAEMLCVNNTLSELDLRNNHIGGGLVDLDEALKNNTSVIKIDLWGNGKIYRWAGKGTVDSLLKSINRNRERKGLAPLKTLD